MTAPADLRAACERCDDPVCEMPSARAAWRNASPGAAEDAAGEALDRAAADCRAREEVDWRAEALRLRGLIEAVRAAAGSYPRGKAVDALLAATGGVTTPP